MIYASTQRAKERSDDDITSQVDTLLHLPVGSKLPSFEVEDYIKKYPIKYTMAHGKHHKPLQR